MQVRGSNGLAPMSAAKRPKSVAPEVNMRNPLHTSNNAHKRGNLH